MAKRIGILTFHRALNYGAVLQVFALRNFLIKYGNCEVVDYRCESIENVYYKRKTFFNFIKSIIKSIIFPKREFDLRKRKTKFKAFLNNELVLSPCSYFRNNISKANESYDYFVCGSDQVWNTKITNKDFTYFLDFTSKCRVAYACSFGSIESITETKFEVVDLIKKINYVSVREKEGNDFIKETISQKKSALVCDPVFLVSKKEWENLGLKSNLKLNEPYLLVYEVANGENLIERALDYSKKHNLKLYIIENGIKRYKNKRTFIKSFTR